MDLKFDLTDMLYAFSFALDAVEQELLGLATGHGKRVAYLSLLMGRAYGIPEEQLVDFICCAILHDNALTEFIQEEYQKNETFPENIQEHALNTGRHCVLGEHNIRILPFRSDVKNVILYHHENADGSGPLGKRAEETNVRSQILHLADSVDMGWKLAEMTQSSYQDMVEKIKKKEGKAFSAVSVKAFLESVSFSKIKEMQEKGVDACLREALPAQYHAYSDWEWRNIAEFFARIVDYKSPFTRRHSMGVAKRAEVMARYYKFPPVKTTRYYFAAALHDIGKLIVGNDILEKPGKLDEEEFSKIKNHASATYEVLRRIKGMEDITVWASHHHEKLDGSGYPFGLSAEKLSKEERLMTCIDIYQALTEERPYKDGISHEEAIAIMKDMADQGKIDPVIVEDVNRAFYIW